MDIAKTILSQIHSTDTWAQARWGVIEKLATERGLQLNCTKRIKILVDLASDDTYSVVVGRMSGRFDFKVRGEMAGVHAEQLVGVIDGLFSAAFGLV